MFVPFLASAHTVSEPRLDASPVAAAPAAVTDAQREAADRFAGSYEFVGGQAERNAVAAAIEDVVSEMNALARSIARGRLEDGNRVASSLGIERDGDELVIAFDDRSNAASLDGSFIQITGNDGDPLRYRIEVEPGELRQSFIAERGRRNNRLRIGRDHRLVLHVVVTSKLLPKALKYRLTYARR